MRASYVIVLRNEVIELQRSRDSGLPLCKPRLFILENADERDPEPGFSWRFIDAKSQLLPPGFISPSLNLAEYLFSFPRFHEPRIPSFVNAHLLPLLIRPCKHQWKHQVPGGVEDLLAKRLY